MLPSSLSWHLGTPVPDIKLKSIESIVTEPVLYCGGYDKDQGHFNKCNLNEMINNEVFRFFPNNTKS